MGFFWGGVFSRRRHSVMCRGSPAARVRTWRSHSVTPFPSVRSARAVYGAFEGHSMSKSLEREEEVGIPWF